MADRPPDPPAREPAQPPAPEPARPPGRPLGNVVYTGTGSWSGAADYDWHRATRGHA
jgi:hypothetical protein